MSLFDDSDAVFILFGLAIGLFFLVGVPIMAVVAYRRSGELRDHLGKLQSRVTELEKQLAAGGQKVVAAARPPAAAPLPVVPPPAPEDRRVEVVSPPEMTAAPTAPMLPEETAAAPIEEPVIPAPSPEPVVIPEPPAQPAVAPERRRPAAERQSLELLLGARGFVWIGGLSIALAGAFFVKYSLDQGLLSPAARIALALLFGVALLIAGEVMRGRSRSIGQALVAAGFADLFASLFAAHALYDLIPAALDFVLLGVVTAGGILAALRHGAFVGLVGIAGGFLTPALLGGGDPHPTALFVFLFLITFGALLLWRRRRWWYVAGLGLAGSLTWVWFFVELNWIEANNWRTGELQVPIFLLALSALLIWTFDGRTSLWGKTTPWARPLTEVERIIDIGGNLIAALFLAVWLANGGYNALDWTFLIVVAVLQLLAARLFPKRELVGFATAALTVVTLATMPFTTTLYAGATAVNRESDILILAAIQGILFTLGAYGISFGTARPVRWSGLSVVASAALFAIVYIDFRQHPLLFSWPIIAVLLAALHLIFAERLFNRRGTELPYRASFALHCLAVIGFIAAAIPLQVGSGWVAVIWALMMPPVIWIADRLDEIWLRRVIWVAVPGILLALFLSGFPVGERPILNWLLYGVGVPFAAFLASGWLLRRKTVSGPTAEERGLRLLVDLTTAFLGFLLISLEVRQFFHGSHLLNDEFTLVEAATLGILWLAGAYTVIRAARLWDEAKLVWAAVLLAALGVAAIVFGPILFLNPLFNAIEIGTTPIFNQALYAFIVTAVCCFIAAHGFDSEKLHIGADERDLGNAVNAARNILGGLAIFTGFVGISILNRQLFAGTIVQWPADTFLGDLKSDGELYGYSVGWLLYGALLILLAVITDRRPLRHAAAGIILIAVLKVFLIDAAGLTGLYRVASFLGLGLCLIALGYLYQRFVLLRRR